MMRIVRGWFSVVLAVALAASLVAFAGPAGAQSASQPRVYLLRGLANIFSLGMDDLAAKLNARGIKATVHSYAEWQTLSNYAMEQSRAAGGRTMQPIVIIGHSLGADAAIYMGNRVTELGGPVPLVVTFDPVTPTTASSKIGRVVNYYQAGGSGKPVGGAKVSNIDLTRSGQLTHFNIEKAANLHNDVIAMIVKTRPVARKPRPKPIAAPAAAPAAVSAETTGSTAPPATPATAAAASSPATPASAPSSDAKPAAAPM